MVEPYLIKKYSSRRLYDVAAGAFLTLEDIDRLIRQGKRIKAVDAKGKDITRSVLLQILTEREEGGEPLLSVELLHEIVRLYGNVMQGPFGRYLEEGMAMLRKQQDAWQSALPQALRSKTTDLVGKLMEQQAAWWDSAQSNWFGNAKNDQPATGQPGKRRKSGGSKA